MLLSILYIMMAWKGDFVICLAMIIASVIGGVLGATRFIVGDEKGWTLDVDYQAWAKSNTFYEGDTLLFQYENKHHNVHIVDEKQFQSCAGSGTRVLISGNDTVNLPVAGRRWYICGVGRHCKDNKMHMFIDVLSLPPPPPPPPSSPPPASASSVVVSTDHFAWVIASIIMLVCHHWTY